MLGPQQQRPSPDAGDQAQDVQRHGETEPALGPVYIRHDGFDLIGEEALSKGLENFGIEPPSGNALFTATLAADLLSNAAYYSLIGLAKKKHLLVMGAATGLTAGIGALALTKPMGLSDAPVTRTEKTKLLTAAWYTFGGLVASSVILALRKK